MPLLRIAVCDRDGLLCKSLIEQLTHSLRDLEEPPEILLSPDGEALLEQQRIRPLSYLFLELNQPRLQSVLTLAEKLWALHSGTRIIFMSDQPDLVFAALRLPFFHFIRKDCLEQDLDVALKKLRREQANRPDFCLFHSGSGLEKVTLAELLYMESYRHTIVVHCESRSFTASETLSQLCEALRENGFLLIHKSYLVNLYHIASIHKTTVTLDDGTELQMSRHRAMEVRQRFETYIRRLGWL